MSLLSCQLALVSLGLGLATVGALPIAQVVPARAQPKSHIPANATPLAATSTEAEASFARHFRALEATGSIFIYDLNSDRVYQHNPDRNATAFLPASTFKILNSLIALETQVVPDAVAILTWDGIERSFPVWNRDLNMREAFKHSAVWFYQVLARRIGHERMKQWVARVGYGNQNIGPEVDIDRFWLVGELRITPQEQTQFLRRLYQNDLPFSRKSLATVKDIMIVEQTPHYTLRAKTGWVSLERSGFTQIGWYVGYLERDGNAFFFATNIDIRTNDDAPKRLELTRRCLEDLGLFEPDAARARVSDR